MFMVVIFLNVGQNLAYESHLICKRVEDVFTPSPHERPPSNVVRGPPGKRGAPGQKGEVGNRGEKGDEGSPADVNYQLIEQTVERKIIESE